MNVNLNWLLDNMNEKEYNENYDKLKYVINEDPELEDDKNAELVAGMVAEKNGLVNCSLSYIIGKLEESYDDDLNALKKYLKKAAADGYLFLFQLKYCSDIRKFLKKRLNLSVFLQLAGGLDSTYDLYNEYSYNFKLLFDDYSLNLCKETMSLYKWDYLMSADDFEFMFENVPKGYAFDENRKKKFFCIMFHCLYYEDNRYFLSNVGVRFNRPLMFDARQASGLSLNEALSKSGIGAAKVHKLKKKFPDTFAHWLIELDDWSAEMKAERPKEWMECCLTNLNAGNVVNKFRRDFYISEICLKDEEAHFAVFKIEGDNALSLHLKVNKDEKWFDLFVETSENAFYEAEEIDRAYSDIRDFKNLLKAFSNMSYDQLCDLLYY